MMRIFYVLRVGFNQDAALYICAIGIIILPNQWC